MKLLATTALLTLPLAAFSAWQVNCDDNACVLDQDAATEAWSRFTCARWVPDDTSVQADHGAALGGGEMVVTRFGHDALADLAALIESESESEAAYGSVLMGTLTQDVKGSMKFRNRVLVNQAPEVVQHRVTCSDRTLANLQAHFKVATDIEHCPSSQNALNEAIEDGSLGEEIQRRCNTQFNTRCDTIYAHDAGRLSVATREWRTECASVGVDVPVR